MAFMGDQGSLHPEDLGNSQRHVGFRALSV